MKKCQRQAIFEMADQIGDLLCELEDGLGLSFEESDAAMQLCREFHCEGATSIPEKLHRQYRKHLLGGPAPRRRVAAA